MWNVARWQAAVSLSPYSKRPIKPTDLVRFDWDEKPPRTKQEWIKENLDVYNLANKIAEA